MKVAIVGAGYAGLSTAVCMAMKFRTVAVDKDRVKVAELVKGKAPMREKGLANLMKRGMAANRLSFSSEVNDLAGSDAIFIAVGTPSNADGSIDLSQVRDSCIEISTVVRRAGNKPLVMVRSTVTPGTTREVVKPLLEQGAEKRCGEGFGLCCNPEFLREGAAIQDTLAPQRLVIGAVESGSLLAARSLYRRFYGSRMPPVVETTPEGAELTKYASNSFLASKVSFINMIARVCELYPGTDVGDISRGMGLDSRIGQQFLQAGPGFGGSCFPKDVRAFAAYLRQLAVDSSMLEGALSINDFQPEHVVALAEKKAGSLSGKIVAVLGIAFKAETSDIRESRSIAVITGLLQKGASVRVYDPAAMEGGRRELGSSVTYSTSARDCLSGADVAITMTAWREFKRLLPRDFVRLMRSPVIVDARRVFDPAKYSRGLNYAALGRGADETR